MSRAYGHGFLAKGRQLAAQCRNLAADPRELKSIVHGFAPNDVPTTLPPADYEHKFAASVARLTGAGSPIMRGLRSRFRLFLMVLLGAACWAAEPFYAVAAQPTSVATAAASSSVGTQPVALSQGRRS